MLIKIIYIAAGGAIGSSLRFLFQNLFKIFFHNLPVGTFFVNILGCFFIGLLSNYLISKDFSQIFIRYFFIIGILGSFTTFSAFSFETIELFKQGKLYISIGYVVLSVFFSIIAAYIGLTQLKF